MTLSHYMEIEANYEQSQLVEVTTNQIQEIIIAIGTHERKKQRLPQCALVFCFVRNDVLIYVNFHRLNLLNHLG